MQATQPPPNEVFPALRIVPLDAAGRPVTPASGVEPLPEVMIRVLFPDGESDPPQRVSASGTQVIPVPLAPPVVRSRVVVSVVGSSSAPLVLESWDLFLGTRPVYDRARFVIDGGEEPGGTVPPPPPTRGEDDFPSSFDNGSARREVEKVLQSWKRAWEERDLDQYLSHYDPDFWTEDWKLDLQGYRRSRATVFQQAGWISIRISRLQISFESADMAGAEFLQEYRSQRYSDLGDKSLALRKRNGRWLILMESFRDNPEERRKRDQDRLLRVGIPVEPVDEAIQDPGLVELRSAILRAVAARDVERLREFVLPGESRNGRTGESESHFGVIKRSLQLDDPDSEAWGDLELALRGGGAFVECSYGEPLRKQITFWAPYGLRGGPEGVVGRHDVVLLGGEDILIKRDPSPTAPVVRTVSHVLLKKAEQAPHHEDWTAVELPDGGTGWVASRLVRGSFDRQAIFVKKDGLWWLASFQGGC